MLSVKNNVILLILVVGITSDYVRITAYDLMKCSYGERGSLTATCYNATPGYFKNTPYRFDNLDETLRCLNCSLQTLDTGTFDISGNQIQNLDLSKTLINTIRQRAFVGLIFLKKLILSNNEIKSIHPGTFIGVKKINYVDLQNNHINILLEDGFLELINLKILNLHNNQIKTISPKSFNGLVNLNYLDLSYNLINDFKNAFDNLTSLEVLDLRNNKISNLQGDEFNNLTSLLQITFTNNFIKIIPSKEFVTMNNLRQLDLSYNMLNKINAGSFEGLKSLENLDLSNNLLNEIPQKALQNLYNLRNLNISNNRLIIFQTGLYSGLPQLRVLNLSYNAIENIEITGVFSLHSLHTLDFSNNSINDVDYVALITRLPRISYLNLEDNSLPCNLENEMEEYFKQDNFKFILYRNELGSIKCIKDGIQQTNKKIQTNYVANSIIRHENVSNTNIWIFTLITIILVLIGVLYYLQIRTIQELRIYSPRRATSEVQLLSSDLQARDNEYLNK